MKDLVAEMRFRRTQMLPGVESYVRETLTGDDREASLKLVQQMHLWVPVLRIGNGDFICIDASMPDAPIRYDSHESLPSDNGLFMAANLNVFLTEWADKCFQEPQSLYWPSCVGKHGVNWSSKDFGYPRIK